MSLKNLEDLNSYINIYSIKNEIENIAHIKAV